MRSAILKAAVRSWVMQSTVAPSRSRIWRISSLIVSDMIGSRPVVGSSTHRKRGLCAMARASATRLRMPPDSSEG